MLIKAYVGDGAWTLWEADADYLRFLGQHQWIGVPNGDYDFDADDRFPPVENADLHVLHTQDPIGDLVEHHDGPTRLMRWVDWRCDGRRHVLVTDGDVYICNDRGETVEALR